MVAAGKLAQEVHRALENSTVKGAYGPGILARDYGDTVPTLKLVLVAHSFDNKRRLYDLARGKRQRNQL